jgi:hypothetical protein
MKNILVVFTIILLCFAVSVARFGQMPTSTKALSPLEQTMIVNEKGYIAAAKKGDAEFFQLTLTEDYSQVGIDGQLHDRQEVLGEMSSGGAELTPYSFKVVELGQGAAIITYDLIVRVPPEEDQGPPPRYQHFSSVWVKQGDAWKLKFQQTTPTHWGDW